MRCRFIGFNLLPISSNLSDAVKVAVQTLYAIPNFTISDVQIEPSAAVPSIQHAPAGGEGAAAGAGFV